jgi:hypothetical protein
MDFTEEPKTYTEDGVEYTEYTFRQLKGLELLMHIIKHSKLWHKLTGKEYVPPYVIKCHIGDIPPGGSATVIIEGEAIEVKEGK